MRVSLDLLVVPQNPGDKRTLFVRIRQKQLHDTDNTTCTTQCEQHDLALLLTFTTKIFVEFPNFSCSYDLLRYMLQNTFHTVYQSKNTHLQISNRFNHALPWAQHQKYVRAGPQGGPVIIKATLSKTRRWCTVTPSNTSLTKDTRRNVKDTHVSERATWLHELNDFEKGRQWMRGLRYRRWPTTEGLDRRVTVFTGSYRPASTPQNKGRYVAHRTTATTITVRLINDGCAKRRVTAVTGRYRPASTPQKRVGT